MFNIKLCVAVDVSQTDGLNFSDRRRGNTQMCLMLDDVTHLHQSSVPPTSFRQKQYIYTSSAFHS